METEKKNMDFADFQAHERAIVIGRRYLNIFHQLHVINAGIEVLNKDFLSLPDDVVNILPELSGGLKFYQHIQNLKNGVTPIDKIDVDLLPFGKDVFDSAEKFHEYTDRTESDSVADKKKSSTILQNTHSEIQSVQSQTQSVSEPVIDISESSDDNEPLFALLRGFKATPADLNAFKQNEVIRDLGPNWKIEINKILTLSHVSDKKSLKRNFDTLCVFDTALGVWEECVAIVKNPRMKSPSEIAANLPNYQKYLAMFGTGGKDLLAKVKLLAK